MKKKKKLEEKEAKKSLKDKQKKEPPAKIDEDKEYAKILLSRNAGSWHRGDDEIFSKISDEILICEVYCHASVEYYPNQFDKLTPDLVVLVADFAGHHSARNEARPFSYNHYYNEEERYIFDKDVIIKAIKQFTDIKALKQVRDRASCECPPFPIINDSEIYAEISTVADERIKELTG